MKICRKQNLNPDYALDFVMKTKDTIKLNTHELFLDE